MGDGDHLALVDWVQGSQPRPGRLGHDHDEVGACAQPHQDRGLVRGWAHRHRVQDDDHGDLEVAQHIEDLGPVLPAEDPVLVLHDGHVACVQGRGGALGRSLRSVPQDPC
jgi:hypothetical protein